MRKIKIRFIERQQKRGLVEDYMIQQKKWYGWRYINKTENVEYMAVKYHYCKDTKEALLDEVLSDYFKVSIKFIQIEEHPTIKLY